MVKLMSLLKILEWIIFIALILLLIAILSPVLPIKNYLSSYVIVSGSMEPTIKTGSLSFISPIKDSNLYKDDIIAFKSPDNPNDVIVHRVFSIQEDQIKTKGDNNDSVDSWVVTNFQVIGKHVFSIPYLGKLTLFIRTPLGFALIIGIPGLVLLVMQIKKIREGIEEEIQKRTKEALNQKHEKISSITEL